MSKRGKWSLARRAAASAAWTPEKRAAYREAAKARWALKHKGAEPPTTEEAPNEKKPALPEVELADGGMREAGLRRLRVEKVCINLRLVEGKLVGEEDGVMEVVDVGRNANFAIGDELWVRRHPEVLELWEFVGMTDTELPVDMVGLPRDRRRVR